MVEELHQRGLTAALVDADLVVIDYEIETGPLAGESIELAFKPPPDYPVSPPSGLIMRPHVMPINPEGGDHPRAGVHLGSHQGLSDDWQYWSRPYADWNTGKRNLDALLGHVRHLFDTLPHDLQLHVHN